MNEPIVFDLYDPATGQATGAHVRAMANGVLFGPDGQNGRVAEGLPAPFTYLITLVLTTGQRFIVAREPWETFTAIHTLPTE